MCVNVCKYGFEFQFQLVFTHRSSASDCRDMVDVMIDTIDPRYKETHPLLPTKRDSEDNGPSAYLAAQHNARLWQDMRYLLCSFPVVVMLCTLLVMIPINAFSSQFCVDEYAQIDERGAHSSDQHLEYASRCSWCGADAECTPIYTSAVENSSVEMFKNFWVAMNTLPNVVFVHAIVKMAICKWAHSRGLLLWTMGAEDLHAYQKHAAVRIPQLTKASKAPNVAGFSTLVLITLIFLAFTEILSVSIVLIYMDKWMIVV